MKGFIVKVNPVHSKKKSRSTMSKKRGRSHKKSARKHGKRRNPSGKSRKHGKKRNPGFTNSIKGLFSGPLVKGLSIALGAVGVGVIAQNILPADWQGGTIGAVVTAGLALAAGWLASKVSALRPYAGFLAVGGVTAAALGVIGPAVLPRTKFLSIGELDSRRLLRYGGVGEFDRRTVARNPRLNPIPPRTTVGI